jgi:hypothetical protein
LRVRPKAQKPAARHPPVVVWHVMVHAKSGVAEVKQQSEPPAKRGPGREGMRAVSCWVPPPIARELRMVCAAADTTIQQAMVEALTTWLKDRRVEELPGTGDGSTARGKP